MSERDIVERLRGYDRYLRADLNDVLDEAAATIETLRANALKKERDLEQLVQERDDAEQAMSRAYLLVLGRSPEWSNHFGYMEANEEIADAIYLLRKAAHG